LISHAESVGHVYSHLFSVAVAGQEDKQKSKGKYSARTRTRSTMEMHLQLNLITLVMLLESLYCRHWFQQAIKKRKGLGWHDECWLSVGSLVSAPITW
jgi:hypothetical protein